MAAEPMVAEPMDQDIIDMDGATHMERMLIGALLIDRAALERIDRQLAHERRLLARKVAEGRTREAADHQARIERLTAWRLVHLERYRPIEAGAPIQTELRM